MKHINRRLLPVVMLVLCAQAVPCSAGDFSMTPGGVAYRDLQTGSGAMATTGDVVTVHLTGWVEQQAGTKPAFFNTHRDKRPLRFLVGTPRVMQGWNEGVQGMRPGGRRLLHIPPELGIGGRSFEDSVPPNARLVFIVELLDVRPAISD